MWDSIENNKKSMGFWGQTMPGFFSPLPWGSNSYTSEGVTRIIINDYDSNSSYILDIYYLLTMLSAEHIISFSFQNNQER